VCVCVCVCVMAAMAGIARAQSAPEQHHWSELRVRVSGWHYNPIVNESGNVTGFLALAHAGSTTGDNLRAVWYRKELAGC